MSMTPYGNGRGLNEVTDSATVGERWHSEGDNTSSDVVAKRAAWLNGQGGLVGRENAALRACALRYLGWLGVSNPAAALEDDLRDPDILRGIRFERGRWAVVKANKRDGDAS